MKFDLVIMTFGQELPMLILHAESLHRNFDKKLINQIIILVNDKNSEQVIESINNNYKHLFLDLESKVVIVDGIDLINDKTYYENNYKEISIYSFDNKGFLSQMITDCSVSKLISTEFYIVIDSKSLYIPSKFSILADNKIKLPVFFHNNNGCNANIWKKHLDFFNTEDILPKCLPNTLRPFVYHTQTVIDMIEFIQDKEQISWTNFLIKEFTRTQHPVLLSLTHYYLYCAYCVYKKSLSNLYQINFSNPFDFRIINLSEKFDNNNSYLTITVARSVFVEYPNQKDKILRYWKQAIPESKNLEYVFNEMAKLNIS